MVLPMETDVLGCEYCNDIETAVTNAHCASLRGLPVGPVPLSTTPVPLRKVRARHRLHPQHAE